MAIELCYLFWKAFGRQRVYVYHQQVCTHVRAAGPSKLALRQPTTGNLTNDTLNTSNKWAGAGVDTGSGALCRNPPVDDTSTCMLLFDAGHILS